MTSIRNLSAALTNISDHFRREVNLDRSTAINPTVQIVETVKPAEQRTIIGHTVVNMTRTYDRLADREVSLTAEIARLQEELRQTEKALTVLGVAISSTVDDPALTEDERQMIVDAVTERNTAIALTEIDIGEAA